MTRKRQATSTARTHSARTSQDAPDATTEEATPTGERRRNTPERAVKLSNGITINKDDVREVRKAPGHNPTHFIFMRTDGIRYVENDPKIAAACRE